MQVASIERKIEAGEHFGLKNAEICRELGLTEQELSEYQADMDLFFAAKEKERKQTLDALRKSVSEWLQEPEMVEARKNYLIEMAREAVHDPENPKFRELKYKLRAFRDGAVTSDEIERAREYPIKEAFTEYGVKVRNNMALCPFHNEKTPSLAVSNNLWYCHGCQEGGDVIDIVMRLGAMPFREAVHKLS